VKANSYAGALKRCDRLRYVLKRSDGYAILTDMDCLLELYGCLVWLMSAVRQLSSSKETVANCLLGLQYDMHATLSSLACCRSLSCQYGGGFVRRYVGRELSLSTSTN